jgi:predicted dienelactone hydrolase
MMSTDAPLLSCVISLLSLALCVGASNGAPPAKVPARVPAKVVETPKASATIELIEFPDLVDATRGAKAPTEKSRPRLLPRRKQEEPAAPAATGRKVPIKVHVPSTGGPFPVIVVSHGAGGDWDTHFTQAQQLASDGYIVLCLEHVGSNRERLAKGIQAMKSILAMTRDAGEVLTRPKDVSFAIDRATEWNATHMAPHQRRERARMSPCSWC